MINVTKFILIVFFMVLVIKFIDIEIFFQIIKKVKLQTVFFSFIFMFLCLFLQATRWFFILKKNEISLRFLRIQRINFFSFFFDTFIPGRVGSDVYKYKMLEGFEKKKIISSIIFLRYNFLISLIIFCCYYLISIYSQNYMYSLILTLFFIFFLTFIMDIFFSSFKKLLNKTKIEINILKKLVSLLKEIMEFNLTVSKDKLFFIKLYLIAFMTISLSTVMFYIVAIDLGFESKYSTFGFLTPLLEIANVLPITIHGRGISEFLMWNFLDIKQDKFENIIALSSVVYFVYIFSGLFSGFCLSIIKLFNIKQI